MCPAKPCNPGWQDGTKDNQEFNTLIFHSLHLRIRKVAEVLQNLIGLWGLIEIIIFKQAPCKRRYKLSYQSTLFNLQQLIFFSDDGDEIVWAGKFWGNTMAVRML